MGTLCLFLEWAFEVGPMKPNKEYPWDLIGWDEFATDYDTHGPWKEVQQRELNNGRLAMVAIVGMCAQRALTGEWFGNYVNNYGDYPLFDKTTFGNPFPIFPGYRHLAEISPVFGPFLDPAFGPAELDGV